MKINSLSSNNTNFYAINKSKTKLNNFNKTNPLYKNNLEKDIFVKFGKNISHKQNLKDIVYRIIRNNPTAIIGLSAAMLLSSIGLHSVLLSSLALGLGLISTLALDLPKEVYKYDDTVINPIKDNNLSENQKICKSIFLENFSEDESKNIAKKYQKILNINDKNEFIQTAFDELKSDYKLQNIPIRLKIASIKPKSIFKLDFIAGCMSEYVGLKTYVIQLSSKKLSKKNLLELLVHEMHHVKQDILKYQSLESIDEIIAQKLAFYQNEKIFQNCSEEARLLAATQSSKDKVRMMDKLGIKMNSLKENPLYEYGRKMYEDRFHFVKTYDNYLHSETEIDAIRSAEMMMKLVKRK